MLSACGMVDCDFDRKKFAYDKDRKSRTYGTINFHYADGTEPYVVKLNRVNRSYLAEAPLYSDGFTQINFTAGRDREFKNFAGVRSRIEF